MASLLRRIVEPQALRIVPPPALIAVVSTTSESDMLDFANSIVSAHSSRSPVPFACPD